MSRRQSLPTIQALKCICEGYMWINKTTITHPWLILTSKFTLTPSIPVLTLLNLLSHQGKSRLFALEAPDIVLTFYYYLHRFLPLLGPPTKAIAARHLKFFFFSLTDWHWHCLFKFGASKMMDVSTFFFYSAYFRCFFNFLNLLVKLFLRQQKKKANVKFIIIVKKQWR